MEARFPIYFSIGLGFLTYCPGWLRTHTWPHSILSSPVQGQLLFKLASPKVSLLGASIPGQFRDVVQSALPLIDFHHLSHLKNSFSTCQNIVKLCLPNTEATELTPRCHIEELPAPCLPTTGLPRSTGSFRHGPMH